MTDEELFQLLSENIAITEFGHDPLETVWQPIQETLKWLREERDEALLYKAPKPISYYESHITIEPVFGEDLEKVAQLAREHSFKVADLLMQKRKTDTPVRSSKDTFCTGRGKDYSDLEGRMMDLAKAIRMAGFDVWRTKIEAILYDVRFKPKEEFTDGTGEHQAG